MQYWLKWGNRDVRERKNVQPGKKQGLSPRKRNPKRRIESCLKLVGRESTINSRWQEEEGDKKIKRRRKVYFRSTQNRGTHEQRKIQECQATTQCSGGGLEALNQGKKIRA